MKITFEQVKSKKDIDLLTEIADEVWHEYFPCIITEAQIDYMVEKFQSAHAIQSQIDEQHYEYCFICKDGAPIGYIGFVREAEKMFLSKLYLKKDFRGLGIASKAFEFLKQECAVSGLHAIYLTVNRGNANTIAVYKKTGFHVADERVADIGCGFLMDDYIMELTL